MPILPLLGLPEALPPKARLMGLDLGTKTIGLALSDPGLAIASPLETIRRGKRFAEDAKALLALIEGRGVGGLVLGLPVNMDGSEGPRAQSTRAFAENLLKLKDLPLAFWDERLSTAAVNRFLIEEADMTRRRRAQVVDKMAAAYILQGALDAIRNRKSEDRSQKSDVRGEELPPPPLRWRDGEGG
jgi:putative Holliday junction resolvase